LSVGRIADAVNRSERVIGLHFFNPAPVMELVEVVASRATSAKTVGRSVDLVERWGKTPVRCADSPGFIVNRVNRPFTLEALAIHEANVASVDQVDDALRAEGFPMGPFELMDLIGIDVNLAVATAIWEGFDRAERFRPSALQQQLVQEGRVGRKTGSGFYAYGVDGRRESPHPGGEAIPGAPPSEIVERVRLAIAAEAFRAAEDDIAPPIDIDLAMRLGAGHPQGPFEWVDSNGGPGAVLETLQRLAGLGSRFEVPTRLLAAAERHSVPISE
jgi:3-hydroxybutyryl-CoA dehydrogenase